MCPESSCGSAPHAQGPTRGLGGGPPTSPETVGVPVRFLPDYGDKPLANRWRAKWRLDLDMFEFIGICEQWPTDIKRFGRTFNIPIGFDPGHQRQPEQETARALRGRFQTGREDKTHQQTGR